MKSIFFDSGPIISLAINDLLFLLKKLKNSFGGEFYITESIKREVIEKPLSSKKYKFEAIRVLKELSDGTIKNYTKDPKELTNKLLDLANKTFKAKDNYIQIVHYGEMDVLAAAIESEADAVVIDERTTRILIENPVKIKERLEKKLHTNVEINHENFKELQRIIGKVTVLRSFELVVVAFEKGFLNEYTPKISHPRRELLEGVLWGVKLSGCAVSEDEIIKIIEIEKVD